MKKLLKLFIIFFIGLLILKFSEVSALEQLRGSVNTGKHRETIKKIQKIKAGTFVKVIPTEEINTLSADRQDSFKFINLQDLYLYETNAIPQNTVFYGIVEDVKEPVQGRDGAIKIAVNKMITPENKVYEVKGHIYNANDNYMGGKQTPAAYYHKTYNHSKGFRPMLQVVPMNIYEMGRHTVIKPGAELLVIIEDDIILK